MLLIIRRVNKALAGGHRRAMTARTLAVQRYITRGLMIDVMICPDAAGMTGRTYVRTVFMACGRADQCVRRAVMTGRTAVMNLVVAVARKGRGMDQDDILHSLLRSLHNQRLHGLHHDPLKVLCPYDRWRRLPGCRWI